MMHPFVVLAAVTGLMALPSAGAQPRPARLTFEVATIKPSDSSSRDGGIKPLPGGDGYRTQNVSVKLMISLMFEVPIGQITGAPGWLDSDHYDIVAKADQAYSRDDLHAMFRNLLADRFNLKFHQESKTGRVYALTIDRSGAKMAANNSSEDFAIPITYAQDSVVGRRVSMHYLCWWLGQQMEREPRPVIDKTGLDGYYDFTLRYLPDRLSDAPRESLPAELQDRPTLVDAVREQLGLKLQPEAGPVEYLAIDHVEKPSEN